MKIIIQLSDQSSNSEGIEMPIGPCFRRFACLPGAQPAVSGVRMRSFLSVLSFLREMERWRDGEMERLSQSLGSRDLSVRWRSLRVEPCSNPIPEIKGPAPLRRTGPLMAEGVGFEPTRPCGLLVFKTSAFNHSATPPGFSRMEFRRAGP